MARRRYDEQQRRNVLQERLTVDIPLMVSMALKEDLGQTLDFKKDITGQLLRADSQATARYPRRGYILRSEMVGRSL